MIKDLYKCIDIIENGSLLFEEELAFLIEQTILDSKLMSYLCDKADQVRKNHYGNKIYIRGLIEYTNICLMDCYYCGLRKSNSNVSRYRLGSDEILDCCKYGYELGFRTFVLQGGEDDKRLDDDISKVISKIKKRYPDCAVTLSLGERDYDTYKRWYEAGADRYLLRHESADDGHFSLLHPKEQTLDRRKEALYHLKNIGFQTGAGMMVGSPGQEYIHLARDLEFLRKLDPQMVGIGPFLPQKDTVFSNKKPGSVDLTIAMVALTRLILPSALIPATTALATAAKDGRQRGIKSGANVIMPNLSPQKAKEKYNIYDGKLSSGLEAAEYLEWLKQDMKNIGYEIVNDRGDYVQS